MRSNNGGFISYVTQSNLSEVDLYTGFNNRSKPSKDKRHFKTKSKPPVITIKSRKSPKLSPEEQITIDEICASGEVFFKPRKRKTAEFESFEPWHFIFPDLHSYQGWLYSNRLTNAMYSGWDFDVFDLTESGEGLL
ncbi:hypothetical protein ACFH54_003677 [Klebsiella pneumoniae]